MDARFKSLAVAFRAVRETLHLSQERMARHYRVSYQGYRRWEGGSACSAGHVYTLLDLARAASVSLTEEEAAVLWLRTMAGTRATE